MRAIVRCILLTFAIVGGTSFLYGQVCKPFVGSSGPFAGNVTLTGTGYAKYLPTSAKRVSDAPTEGSTISIHAAGAVMSVAVASIRYRTDGTNPTSTSGVLLPAGLYMWTEADLPKLREFRFIQATAGAEVAFVYCWK